MKSRFFTISRLLISLCLLALLLWGLRSHLPSILQIIARTDVLVFTSAVLLFMANISLLASRLKLVLVGEGLRIPYNRVLQLSFVGFFFNNFMPTAVGGDIVKAYYAYTQTEKLEKSFVSVFMDRFIGLFSFVAIATCSLVFSWHTVDLFLKKTIILFLCGGSFIFLIILNSRIAEIVLSLLGKLKLLNIGERISKVYKMVHEYRSKKRVILMVMGVSIICQSVYFTVIYLLAKSTGSALLLRTVFLIMPLVSVISMLPSLGGLGIREGAMVLLFGPAIGSDSAFAVSILLLTTLLVTSLVGALIYISAPQFRTLRFGERGVYGG